MTAADSSLHLRDSAPLCQQLLDSEAGPPLDQILDPHLGSSPKSLDKDSAICLYIYRYFLLHFCIISISSTTYNAGIKITLI